MAGMKRNKDEQFYFKSISMKEEKALRIGLIGGGFMGRTHTNGYKRVNDFFPELQYRPELKVVCSRREEKVRAFADQWGYESIETDWKK